MFNISTSVLAVILGGGAGTRLYPLTASRSKPAVPIAGKYRLVDIPISNCINSNIRRMFVLTQFNSASLNKHIKNTYNFGAFGSGFVDILAAEQTPDNPGWFQGTADAVRQSMRHIYNFEFEYILILSGDQLYQMDFAEMIEAHREKGAEITIATIPVAEREASDFGILKVDDDQLITSFIEKPKKELLPDWASDTGDEMKKTGRNYLASMGIYIFNRDTLFEILKETFPDYPDFGKEIMPQSINKYKVVSYQYDGYWTDIGNIYSFFEANIALTEDIPPFNLFDNNNRIYTRSRMLPPAKISGTMVDNTIVAEGSIVLGSSLKNSVIGLRSRVGAGTTIENAYVMGNDFYETLEIMERNRQKNKPELGIGARCFIKNALIDKNARIGDDVKVIGGPHLENTDHPLYTIKDGIIVVKKGAVLNNGFEIS
ncbi:glucose-1-phosphate adenylyltransferase [Filimonas effusa]|uniref:Glucose-1-phosphate adenylyltransferase n=1 Tax=Filimonas effusa TaxID=2508721 RepID=A0A4Q1D8N5_9BACT|nr:glucose-1-phosphate adenylyltransferase [Filimonas effusa]RXK85570.1 glucose-1-phosphate adenylyltransferase [Filimonas effusa]